MSQKFLPGSISYLQFNGLVVKIIPSAAGPAISKITELSALFIRNFVKH